MLSIKKRPYSYAKIGTLNHRKALECLERLERFERLERLEPGAVDVE